MIPEHYIATLRKALEERPTDCFGGPDAAHSSFSDTQKAINYSMTSFLTTEESAAARCNGEIRAAHVQHGILTPGVGEGGRIPRDVFRRHRHEHAHTPGWIRDIADSRGLRLSQAARKHAAVLPSGLCVRHVAHHALSALSRLAETRALASCRVCDRCGGHGCAGGGCVVDVAAAAGGISACRVRLCPCDDQEP